MIPTAEEKQQAMLIWVLAIFTGFIVPLIFFIIGKDKPYVYRQAALSLTLAILTTVGYIASGILMVILIGLILLPAVGIFHLVICIMGAIAVNKGEDFNPPIVSGLCKSMFKV